MKKISLLFITLLVLVSSIVFVGCGNEYKKLKITANVNEIELVIDDAELCSANVIFELSGAKSWGKVNIDSKPSGMVKVEYEIRGNKCGVTVTALYPTGQGAELVITHLGSGKSESLPLNIGCKLQSVESNNQEFLIQTPKFEEGEIFKIIEIPTKQLLNCEPSNYTDTIVWQSSKAILPQGISIISYDEKGNETPAFTQDGEDLFTGESLAIASAIVIRDDYEKNAVITLNPISVLDKKATLYKDVEISVAIMDLLDVNNVKVTSETHGRKAYIADGNKHIDNKELKDLVLISNPDSNKPRKIAGLTGFDFYSTAIIDFSREIKDGSLQLISELNTKFKNQFGKDLYDVEVSTNLDGLTIQEVEFGKIRVIATSNCFGTGEILVKFTPNNCVGDIKEFSIKIPCTVGERATDLKITNNGQSVDIVKNAESQFSATTSLMDSSLLGQTFKVEMLGTNTLSALKKYVIKIDRRLLYIEPLSQKPSDWETKWLNYYTYSPADVDNDGNLDEYAYVKLNTQQAPIFEKDMYYSNKNLYNKTGAGAKNDELDQLTRFENLVSILKDGKQVTFYKDGDQYVSEPLTSNQTIYMKWVRSSGDELSENDYFGVDICNYYDDRYDIKYHEFDKTLVNCKLAFNRQRAVDTISYVPIKLDTTFENSVDVPVDADSDWQFYFEQNLLTTNTSNGVYYGLWIKQIRGINDSVLSAAELADIDIEIKIGFDADGDGVIDSVGDGGVLPNVGWGLVNTTNYKISQYRTKALFNYDSGNTGYENMIIIGLTSAPAACGDYIITMTQGTNEIVSHKIKVYKELTAEDVSISIGNANASGELLQYQYIAEKPEDWNSKYSTYYEFTGGEYIAVKDMVWSVGKAYYKSIARIDEHDGKYFTLTNGDTMYLNNTYILQTLNSSNTNGYDVDVTIKDEGFRNISGQKVNAEMVAYDGEILTTIIVGTSQDGNKIYTQSRGSFNTKTGQQNYVKLTYSISTYTYDYYKQTDVGSEPVEKVIYLYIYEPVTIATFDSTMLYKYDYSSIPNVQLKEEYGKHTLTFDVNNGSETILNYIDVKWTYTADGVRECVFNSVDSASFTFINKTQTAIGGRIVVTIIQFGMQYAPIVCEYSVKKPVLTDQVILDTQINSFASGDGFINLKVGEEIKIDATAKSFEVDANGNNKQVSISGFNYIICSTTGYGIDDVADIDDNGLLSATNAGKAKLIIVAKDRMKSTEGMVITNYFNVGAYLENDAYVMIDIIVSDGSKTNPFLISSADDFRNIVNDYYEIKTIDNEEIKVSANGDTTKTNDYHYALVSNIDLNGQAISFKNFNGTLSSYGTNNRFAIYGVMLDESNPNLFGTLNKRDDELTTIKDVDFHMNINYISTGVNRDSKDSLVNINIGLIGINSAKIEDIVITISGTINANNYLNKYIIGSMVAVNTESGVIKIDNAELVSVKGNINVINSSVSTVILGGVVGENQGTKYGEDIVAGSIIGANISSSIIGSGDDVEYQVYYNNQAATADIKLQVATVDQSNTESAIGGIVGFNNNGIIVNVYSTGSILGADQSQNLTVSNVGGLIGRNSGENFKINKTITPKSYNDITALGSLQFTSDNFQIVNSYSSAVVKGLNNVGGAIGYDYSGAYKKVYYEMYTNQQSVIGNDNVGGLIGYAEDSNIYYCYANNFAWGYKSSVSIYDIVGNNNVGGLVGCAKSGRTGGFEGNDAMNIVSSIASLAISGKSSVSGLVGKLQNYGAIYTAYFYGVINPSVSSNPITQMHTDGNVSGNIPYNNVYSIVNGVEKLAISGSDFYQGTGFKTNAEYNNGKPFVVYVEDEKETNLVSIIPTKIEINKAFEEHKEDDNGNNIGGYYNPRNNAMYKANINGDYVKIGPSYVVYNPNNASHQESVGLYGRFSKMAEVVDTGDNTGDNSNYRTKALVLYYYQFNDMSSDNALNDYYYLNTVSMHDIVSDQGIIVLPATLKRFNLSTSDSSIISVLNDGKLLLNNEGQVTITLISTLNPSISASFVVIVRSKVLEFNLYSSAGLKQEDNLDSEENQTISIIKNSSKIIYADYSSTIQAFNRTYDYKTATNMLLKFSIEYAGDELLDDESIRNYITLNGDYSNGEYTIRYGTPITINVLEYINGKFTITVRPYVLANYNNTVKEVALSSYFEKTFNVITKQGASAINTNKTQFNMMSADDASNLEVKITTDIEVEKLYFEVEALGDKWEIADPYYPNDNTKIISFMEMLSVYYDGTPIEPTYSRDKNNRVILSTGEIDISGIKLKNFIQSLDLKLKLNEKSHYIDESFGLQITFYVLGVDGISRVSTSVHVFVQPQTINSIIALNYRMRETGNILDLDNAYQSQIIRPGSTNIITIDIAPNIAVFDYIEIVDLTVQDKILLQQVDENLNLPEYMDTWTDGGIKLIKYNSTDKYNALNSKFYILARLPEKSTANISHTFKITAFNKNRAELYTCYLTLEAVMYPTVVMTYIDPNGNSTKSADTRDDTISHEVSVEEDLAVGVQAEIDVVTYNVDNGTLKYTITITDNNYNDYTDVYGDMVSLKYQYGRYFLNFDISKRYDRDMQNRWDYLIGKQINVSFSASKSLNGITETCKATISFTIRRIVIHSVSMTNTNTLGQIHGNWNDGVDEDEEFTTQFYFDKTDISYYNDGFWSIKYTLDYTNPSNYTEETKLYDDMGAINYILKKLNTLEQDDLVELYFREIKEDNSTENQLINNYDKDGISIKNKDDKFIIKATESSNINDMQLDVTFNLGYDTNNLPELIDKGNKISRIFGFDVTKPTDPYENYILINNQAEFEAMAEGEFYQLGRDITLTNYSPLNVAIGGLNGDGNTIRFEKSEQDGRKYDEFNVSQLIADYTSGGMYIGLFGTVATDTIIQNLQVDYGTRNIDKQIGGTVIDLNNNDTLIEQNTNEIYFGGIAGKNLGVITNVNVLGWFELRTQYISADHINFGGITAINGETDSTKVATITGCSVKLEMSAMASIGGIAETNSGKITNTNFGGAIISDDINQYVAEVTTAGFVVENLRSGYISLSNVNCENSGLNSSHVDINSVGKTAGFVLSNAGTINNCYIIRTKISSQGNIGGFAYQSSGNISNSYAYAQMDNSLFYNEFIYVSESAGTLTDCYVISDNTIIIKVSGLYKIKINDLSIQECYNGFIFATGEDGIWTMSSYGPHQINAGFKKDFKSCNIYDLKTFDDYFSTLNKETNIDSGIIQNKTFRLVRDIDFEQEGWLENPSTFNKSLQANLEGNDMTISNYNIYKSGDMDSIGLFASVGTEDDSIYVRNLTLKPASIRASNSSSVGAFAGTIIGANIYNVTIDNSEIMILGKNTVGGLAGIIKGGFEIIGINSNISAFATYNHNSSQQYNLYMGKNILGQDIDNIHQVSYAGAIAGIIDGYGASTTIGNIDTYYLIDDLTINGDVKLVAETVGGAFGLVGLGTLVSDVNYNLMSDTVYQGIYVAGGLVGENRGIIRLSNIYSNIVEDSTVKEQDTSNCFNNFARINGGIVGVNIGGLIDSCSSDIYVNTNKLSATAGGIVGMNIGGTICDCQVPGKVDAFFAGGIAGSDYTYDTVYRQTGAVGTATAETKMVYRIILEQPSGNNVVNYPVNSLVNQNSEETTSNMLYRNNKFTDKFIKTYISQKSKYYTFNKDFGKDGAKLVDTYSVYGLVIGVTDIELQNTNGKKHYKATISTENQLTVSLEISSDTRNVNEYDLGDGRKVKPITNITGISLNSYDIVIQGNDISFIYIIAFSSADYEFWSSSQGYGNDYIVVSKNGLTQVESV